MKALLFCLLIISCHAFGADEGTSAPPGAEIKTDSSANKWLRDMQDGEERKRLETLLKEKDILRPYTPDPEKLSIEDRVARDLSDNPTPPRPASLIESIIRGIVATALVLGVAITFRATPWRRAPKSLRALISATAVWLLTVELWGFIWRWDSFFRIDEYIMMHASFPLIVLTAWLAYRWNNQQ